MSNVLTNGQTRCSVTQTDGNSEIDRVVTTAAHVILSEAKNLSRKQCRHRDSSLRSE